MYQFKIVLVLKEEVRYLILLERLKPEKIALLEAAIRRLSSKDPLFLQFQKQLAWVKSGYVGEKRVDREWIDMKIQFPHILLHGLMAENDQGFQHQLDTLFLSQHFVFVLEIKYYSGFIEFNEQTHQCIKKNFDGVVESYSNPIDQVRRHRSFVRQQLLKLGIDLPVECAVVFSNPKSILERVDVLDVHLFHVTGLRYKLSKMLEKYKMQKIFSEKELMSIGYHFLGMHHIKPWKISLDRKNLRTGVLCSECNFRETMKYKYGRWICMKCGNDNRVAILEALNDYRLLWNDNISNREFREFTGVESKDAASRILRSLGFKSVGTFKDKWYIIPSELKIL